ncbi:MAG TPA: sensor histidine kinase, partial [Stellaceae bacterium]|nr:sensor histidine kinase [Stellaceae bacterium]
MIGLPKGLSARLLLLTFAFVMVSVVLVFVPSVARFRFNYLEDRIEAARLAILTLEATPDFMVSQELANKLLAHVGAHGIAEHRSSLARPLMIDAPTPPHIDRTYDLHEAGLIELMGDAVMTLADHDDHILRVLEVSDMNSEKSIIEVLLDEAPMRAQMWDFGARVLELSIIISLVTAALLYVSLQWLLVAPLRRLTSSMISFRKDPEDASRIIGTSTRADELGLAQREFSILQETVRQALRQKERLAALGTAVTKINHDLRSILSTVRLMSDALADSEAPEVKRVLPTLIAAIDRAVSLCTRTLNFTGENAPALACRPFALGELVAELVPTLASCGENPP